MDLYFLRHGKAGERSQKWRPDSTRPLTGEGEKKMLDTARGIKTLEVSFDLILTSPYIRALRTAEIFAEVFKSKKLFESKNLIPEADPKAIIAEIKQAFPTQKRIVLVGHEPFLSRLISLLLCGNDTMAIHLRKAGFCKLSIDHLHAAKCGCLEWLMTSRQLSRIGCGQT